MKISFTFIFYFVFLAFIFSQNKIDNVVYRASYAFSYKTQPEQTEFAKTDLMYLDIGKNSSKFYSRYKQARDSAKLVGIKQGLSPHEIVENIRKLRKGISSIVYTFPKKKEFHIITELVNNYIYQEPMLHPTWKIEPEKKEIAGYMCQKATAQYLGREWTVYFALEIPINQGPWKLWGTSGLIVEAKDNGGLFLFELNGFEALDDKPDMWYTNRTATGQPYIKTTKKELTRLEELYYKNFIEFTRLFVMESMGSIHLSEEQKYQQFKKKGGVPYIPLEPW